MSRDTPASSRSTPVIEVRSIDRFPPRERRGEVWGQGPVPSAVGPARGDLPVRGGGLAVAGGPCDAFSRGPGLSAEAEAAARSRGALAAGAAR